MFGSDWDKAEATIVARNPTYTTGDGMVTTYEYVADVRLADGGVLRATLKEPTIATDFWAPGVGAVVSVLVRDDREKVKFDTDDPRLSAKAVESDRDAAFEQAKTDPPGTPPSGRQQAAE